MFVISSVDKLTKSQNDLPSNSQIYELLSCRRSKLTAIVLFLQTVLHAQFDFSRTS